MKKEPCIRLGMRISPKMSENPAESRNSKPPRVMLFVASSSQRLMARTCARPLVALLQVLRRRKIARVDGLLEELVLLIGPELADVRVGLDGGVDELAVLALAAAHEHGADHVAEAVESHWTARGVGEGHVAQGLHESLLIARLVAGLSDRLLDALAGDVGHRRIAAGQHVVVLLHGGHEALVAWGVVIGRIEAGRDHAGSLIPEALEQGVVHARPPSRERNLTLEPEVRVGAHELYGVRAGEAVEDTVGIADLGN